MVVVFLVAWVPLKKTKQIISNPSVFPHTTEAAVSRLPLDGRRTSRWRAPDPRWKSTASLDTSAVGTRTSGLPTTPTRWPLGPRPLRTGNPTCSASRCRRRSAWPTSEALLPRSGWRSPAAWWREGQTTTALLPRPEQHQSCWSSFQRHGYCLAPVPLGWNVPPAGWRRVVCHEAPRRGRSLAQGKQFRPRLGH